MEKRFIRNGRLCEVLDEEIGHIHSFEATENMQWIKVGTNSVCSVMRHINGLLYSLIIEKCIDPAYECDKG